MLIQRSKNEITINFSNEVDVAAIDDVLRFARYKELTAKYSTPRQKVDDLARQINRTWWKKNRKKLVE